MERKREGKGKGKGRGTGKLGEVFAHPQSQNHADALGLGYIGFFDPPSVNFTY